jgi:serine/threonine-protein kinase HipA
LLRRRFDREGAQRIPFLSAMSMLGAKDHETRSSMEFVDALRQHGAAARQDMEALWRRLVFIILISNTDDHLRNHGFLYAGPTGWRLSPAYDLNPHRPTSNRACSRRQSTRMTRQLHCQWRSTPLVTSG